MFDRIFGIVIGAVGIAGMGLLLWIVFGSGIALIQKDDASGWAWIAGGVVLLGFIGRTLFQMVVGIRREKEQRVLDKQAAALRDAAFPEIKRKIDVFMQHGFINQDEHDELVAEFEAFGSSDPAAKTVLSGAVPKATMESYKPHRAFNGMFVVTSDKSSAPPNTVTHFPEGVRADTLTSLIAFFAERSNGRFNPEDVNWDKNQLSMTLDGKPFNAVGDYVFGDLDQTLLLYVAGLIHARVSEEEQVYWTPGTGRRMFALLRDTEADAFNADLGEGFIQPLMPERMELVHDDA